MSDEAAVVAEGDKSLKPCVAVYLALAALIAVATPNFTWAAAPGFARPIDGLRASPNIKVQVAKYEREIEEFVKANVDALRARPLISADPVFAISAPAGAVAKDISRMLDNLRLYGVEPAPPGARANVYFATYVTVDDLRQTLLDIGLDKSTATMEWRTVAGLGSPDCFSNSSGAIEGFADEVIIVARADASNPSPTACFSGYVAGSLGLHYYFEDYAPGESEQFLNAVNSAYFKTVARCRPAFAIKSQVVDCIIENFNIH